MATGRLPTSHYPVEVALRAMALRTGLPYSRSILAEAQRRLFDLGVFGMVRLVEQPHRCDSQDRCDSAADPADEGAYVRVDVQIHVSPTRPYRIRAGFGVQVDQSRSDVHLLGSYEHVRIPLFGRMARWRIDERPLVFSPITLTGTRGADLVDVGNLLSMDFRIPEVAPGVAVGTSVSWDLGPDPVNPTVTHRSAVRSAVSVLFQYSRRLLGAVHFRSVRLDYYRGSASLDVDPIFRQQYQSQTYSYLEQQLTLDRRDSVLQTRHGIYLSLLTQESATLRPLSSYSFVRAALDVRGFVPLSSRWTFAARGFGGAVLGLADGVDGWPVPNELRFYTGGATSNRGYAYNQAGLRATVPVAVPGDPRTLSLDATGAAQPTEFRFANVGGLLAWELSAELRYYDPPWGLVLFLDTSDATGWLPPPSDVPALRRGINVPVGTIPPRIAGPSGLDLRFDPHPAAGLGFRYISPIGVLRLDLGLRLDDAVRGCGDSAYASDVAAQNRGTDYPWYYVVSRPRCDFFGLPVPMAFHFAIGEAY